MNTGGFRNPLSLFKIGAARQATCTTQKVIRFILIVAVLASLAELDAFAGQQHEHGAENGAPPTLVKGLGSVHHKVSTKNSEAQAFFDQGLAFIYAFNHDEAARSFRHAAELDPELAMAHWGVALAIGPNYNMDVDPDREAAAYQAIQRAVQLESGCTREERGYIDAMAKRFSNDPKADLKQLAVNYKNAMGSLSHRYPNDLDAATLYAESMMDLRPWQLWTTDGKPAEGTLEIVRVLASVLKRDPNHVGANHFYVHALEASPHPERAYASADRLTRLAPAAGHLVHMPAHIYMRTGDYDASVKSNLQGVDVDEAYLKTNPVSGMYGVMYYSHNLHFLAIAASMEGNWAATSSALDKLDANVTPHLKESPYPDLFMAARPLLLVRFHRWDDCLALAQPDKESAKFTSIMRHFARGMAFAATGRLENAASEQAAFQEETKSIPADAQWGFSSAPMIFDIAGKLLTAKIAVARGSDDAAAEALDDAASEEDKLAYDEPPDWYLPARESLGAILCRKGRYSEAATVFRADLIRHPKSGRALLGLAQALKGQRKLVQARAVQHQFAAAWKHADIKLTMADL